MVEGGLGRSGECYSPGSPRSSAPHSLSCPESRRAGASCESSPLRLSPLAAGASERGELQTKRGTALLALLAVLMQGSPLAPRLANVRRRKEQ